ncbi:hypothetical protein [Saccharopolyspora sp. NPDC049426]|uniref:hypothetical protein n=1 Tax=Saccharopolyspora sp. NPDC049426 TaxID=3155652 RepID=UPI003437DE63
MNPVHQHFAQPQRGKGDLLVFRTPQPGDSIEALYEARDAARLAAFHAASLPAEVLRPELAAYGPAIISTLDELYALLNSLWHVSRAHPGVAAETTQLANAQHALGVAVMIAHGCRF